MLNVFLVIIGAILSYAVYALFQSYLINRYAKKLFENPSRPIFGGKIYDYIQCKIILTNQQKEFYNLQKKIYLLRGWYSKTINKYILIISKSLNDLHFLDMWSEDESHNIFNEKWDKRPIQNIKLHNQHLECLQHGVLNKIGFEYCGKIIFNKENYEKFTLYKENYEKNYDIKIDINYDFKK